MQDNTSARPRITTVAATALVIAAIAAFGWLVVGGTADAAGTSGGSAPAVRALPMQSQDDQAAQDGDRDGHPCPEEGQGGGGQGSGSGSGSQAPAPEPESSATPQTEL